MSKTTRNKLSAVAWGGAIFCAFWLLLSANAAVSHYQQLQPHSDSGQLPAWTVKGLGPDSAN